MTLHGLHTVARLAFVCSVSAYSYSFSSKQLSEELGLARVPLETVAYMPAEAVAKSGEVRDGDRCCRQNSSPGSLSDMNHSPSVMNSGTAASVGSRRRNGHVQTCSITEQNDTRKLSDTSAASPSQLYVLRTFEV